MKIMIAVPTAEFARQAIFYDYFNALIKPDGTIASFSHGQSPARNRNLMIKQAIEYECSHILFLDDDLAFKPDLLMNLLQHDVEIVTGLYLMRNFPHQPIIFEFVDDNGACIHHFLSHNEKGLVPIVACGLGACLVKTDVFNHLEYPWIRLGELDKDHWTDDLGFFKRVREAGFSIHCDLDTVVGHMATVTIWPENVNGIWHTKYDTAGTGQVTFKNIVPHLSVEHLKSAGISDEIIDKLAEKMGALSGVV
jgi:hypothetical protein